MNYLVNVLQFYLPLSQFVIYGESDLVWCDNKIPQPTKEQLDEWKISYPHDIAKLNCKNTAKQKISDCDWSVLEDVNLLNKQAFIDYRSYLRNLILNPIENPIWQPEPDPIWN